jgi:hypothetical protein
VDAQGELYVTDVFGGDVYRITGTTPPAPFSDDFEDGDASDWTVDSGTWSVVDGELTNVPARKSRILAPNPPCALCTIEASMSSQTGGADLILLGWWRSAGSHVEVVVGNGKVKVRRIAGGEIVAAASGDYPLGPGEVADVRAVYDGERISVYINTLLPPIVSIRARGLKPGIAGFAVKSRRRRDPALAVGTMDDIRVE